MAFGETVECLASEEFLGNLPFEFDAVGAVPGHGFHPLKARQSRSIPNLQDVHRQGRTAERGQMLKPTDRPSPQSRPCSSASLSQLAWADADGQGAEQT